MEASSKEYLFDRSSGGKTLADCNVRLYPKTNDEKVKVAYSDVARIEFTGKDTAAGKSFETWVKKYNEKKRAGEKNIGIEPEKLELIGGIHAAGPTLSLFIPTGDLPASSEAAFLPLPKIGPAGETASRETDEDHAIERSRKMKLHKVLQLIAAAAIGVSLFVTNLACYHDHDHDDHGGWDHHDDHHDPDHHDDDHHDHP